MNRIVASRVYYQPDQASFAGLSGDFNPVHVDSVTARRIGAGALVVHGIHNVLWCLDSVGQYIPDVPEPASLRVNFDSFVTVNERVDAVLVHYDARLIRLEVRCRGTLALTIVVTFGGTPAMGQFDKPLDHMNPISPIDQPSEKLPTLAGRVPFHSSPAAVGSYFPNAARIFGARRITALTAFTKLIGMVCPGLHSVFNRLSLDYGSDDGENDIGFRVASANLERQRILCAVGGGGWVGTLTSTMRHVPTAQVSMGEVAKHVSRKEFARSVSIVVGGSRGIGEVAAKIIAAGGGQPTVTYNAGELDAQRVATEIRRWGGLCNVMKLDITIPIAAQFAALRSAPNQLLYFATPMIGGRQGVPFDFARLQDFMRFYVAGFYDCCCALIGKGATTLTALYPSTVYLVERPKGLTEYAMAKAAGEELCRDMNLRLTSFHAFVPRFPQLSTDQNPDLSKSGHHSVHEVLLPIIRSMSGALDHNNDETPN